MQKALARMREKELAFLQKARDKEDKLMWKSLGDSIRKARKMGDPAWFVVVLKSFIQKYHKRIKSELWVKTGHILMCIGQYEEAVGAYHEARSLWDDDQALLNLVKAYTFDKDYDSACIYLSQYQSISDTHKQEKAFLMQSLEALRDRQYKRQKMMEYSTCEYLEKSRVLVKLYDTNDLLERTSVQDVFEESTFYKYVFIHIKDHNIDFLLIELAKQIFPAYFAVYGDFGEDSDSRKKAAAMAKAVADLNYKFQFVLFDRTTEKVMFVDEKKLSKRTVESFMNDNSATRITEAKWTVFYVGNVLKMQNVEKVGVEMAYTAEGRVLT